MTEPTAQSGPYSQSAELYWNAGWRGIIPIRGKYPPPDGYTGWSGEFPSFPDIMAWTEDHGQYNIAIRLPGNVVGLDVDAYGDKRGGETFAQKEKEWGPLRPTWISTSRNDGISGIRLFIAPRAGLAWRTGLPGIELCHFGHRYVMAAPSLHPEGRKYRWIGPDGNTSIAVPRSNEFPVLPAAWILGLTLGPHVDQEKLTLPNNELDSWIAELPGARLPPCSFMNHRISQALDQLRHAGASRHDAINGPILELVRHAESGHPGGISAVTVMRDAFLQLVTIDNGGRVRTEADALGEFTRSLSGAVARVRGTPTIGAGIYGDPCRPPVRPLSEPESDEQSPAEGITPGPRLRSSWWPVDLPPILAGSSTEPVPTELMRADDHYLWYPGRVNGLIGPSESGKTWIALEAIHQALAAGRACAMIDFEDTAIGTIARLRALGVTDDEFRNFSYMSPDEMLDRLATDDFNEFLSVPRALVVLDGVNAAMSLLGLDLISNKEATQFYQRILKPIALTGAAVAYVDHTPKNGEETKGGIGAQAKRAMTSGACFRVDIVTPFGVNLDGEMKMTMDKDRAGQVRQLANRENSIVSKVTITSFDDELSIFVGMPPADDMFAPREPADMLPAGEGLMDRVSEFVEQFPTGANTRAVRDGVKGRANTIARALDLLVEQGFVGVENVGLSKVYRCLKPYRRNPLVPMVPGGSA